MKLHATIAENEIDVEIRRAPGRVLANVDGREYELEANRRSSTVMLRTADGKIFDCRVEGNSSSGQPIDVFVGARRYTLTLTDPKHLRSAAAASDSADGAVRIVAPMPGKVVRVLVEQGAQVEAGAGVIVVEAMKMQNEMKSPRAGVVVSIKVKPGDTVNAGDVLAVIE